MNQQTRAVPSKPSHILSIGGDAGMIVATYQIGNTVIRINDAFVARTPEAQELVDIEIATAAYACLVDGESGDDQSG